MSAETAVERRHAAADAVTALEAAVSALEAELDDPALPMDAKEVIDVRVAVVHGRAAVVNALMGPGQRRGRP